MASSPPSHVTQTSEFKMSPEQQKLFNLGFPMVEQYASTPLQQFGGTGIADFSDLEKAAQQQYVGAAPTVQGLADLGNQNAARASDVNNNVLGNVGFQLDLNNNPYLQGAIQAMTSGINKNLTDVQLPNVRAGATQASGMYSGASSKSGIAEGQAITGTNQAISDAVAKALFDQYNRGMGNLNQSVVNNAALANLTPTLQRAQTVAPDMLSAVGGQQRNMEQAKLDEQIQKFYTSQALPLVQAQDIISMIQGLPGGTATGTSTGMFPKQNPLMAGLGALSLGSQLFGGAGAGLFGGGSGGLGALGALLMI